MIVRLGIPACFQRFSAIAVELGCPILISANALRRNGRFRHPAPDLFSFADTALDGAGFVAMLLYGGYQWTVEEYVALAASHPWAWWAAMDFCCEPQIAGDRAEVLRRVRRTAAMLTVCRAAAQAAGIKPPLPVLQGWQPDDYLRCADLMGKLPPLVGLGSVCRRHLGGRDGLMTIIARLDRRLPAGIALHLFGVKGAAVGELIGHPRIASVDSMAWDQAARWAAAKAKTGSTVAHSEAHLRRWHAAQQVQLSAPQARLAV